MFWGNKCPHKFLPRDFGAENGFYWQMASSNVRHHMFLVGLAYPDLAKIKKECAEHTMASVVELSLGSTFSHSWIQLGFISLGHFGWFFFSERNHIKVTLGRSFPRMWCGYDLPSAPMVRMERGGGGGRAVESPPVSPDLRGTWSGAYWCSWETWHVFEMKATTGESKKIHLAFSHSTSRKALYISPEPWSPHSLLSEEFNVFSFTRSFKPPKLSLKQTSMRSTWPF